MQAKRSSSRSHLRTIWSRTVSYTHLDVYKRQVQTQVSGEILGRAATVMKSLLVASQPIAAVLFGYLAGVASIGPLFIDVGIALIAVTSLLYIPFAELRRAKY